MPAFAANLTMNYPELEFLERFDAAARDGFKGIEFLFPYDFDRHDLKARVGGNDLHVALFNAPPGNWDQGERGLAALPGREEEFQRTIGLALEYSRALGNSRLHVMAGLRDNDIPYERQMETYLRNIEYAALQAKSLGLTIVLEAINTRNMPGYFMNYQEETKAVCDLIGADNVKIQFDLYHAQIMQGDLVVRLETLLESIGHIQAASVPDRHEPNAGEVNYPYLFEWLDRVGYRGWIGCEYNPRSTTSEGLGWLGSWRGAIAKML
ncbi:hydroxypyruvate isomerase family protein [Gluconobacter sp. NFX36]|uniref:2-oxo-tetronate isomerase n=1 Tax=Gluconobacter TaxID=441 RepID=UPI0003D39ABE|nr:hydroxypyruvate isomerase [Gluconobacter frateurii NBRC 103465]